MRVCSLLPSATEILFALGLEDFLVAVTHECDYPPRALDRPIASRAALELEPLSSRQIDQAVSQALRAGHEIYTLEEAVLRELHPQLVLTQALCEVCAVTPRGLCRLETLLDPPPRVVSLDPHSVEDILDNVLTVGALCGHPGRARELVERLGERLEQVRLATAGVDRRPVVAALEWLDPVYVAGHWVPGMIELAGGHDPFTVPGQKSRALEWSLVLEREPEVLVLMACGCGLEKTLELAPEVTGRPGFADLPAARQQRVFAVDGSSFFNRPGPRILDGLEILAHLLHPDRAEDPGHGWARIN